MFVARGGNARVSGRCSRSLWAKVNFLLFDRYVYFESRIRRHTSTKSESSSDSPLSAQQSVTKCIRHSAASVSSCPTRFGGVDGGRRGGNGRRLATGNLDLAAQQRPTASLALRRTTTNLLSHYSWLRFRSRLIHSRMYGGHLTSRTPSVSQLFRNRTASTSTSVTSSSCRTDLGALPSSCLATSGRSSA
jgi:hypothetical protein